MSHKKDIKLITQGDYCTLIAEADVSKFLIIYPMIKIIHDEMHILYTTKQDDVLNIFKFRVINKLIISAREILVTEPVLEYLEQLDEQVLPQNSDVIIILCQYIEALDQYKAKNNVYSSQSGSWQWETQENSDLLKIGSPKII